MSAGLLIAFGMSVLFAIGFAVTSTHAIALKAAIVVAALAFGIIAYLLATSSPISPFSRPAGLAFGTDHSIASIVVALVGAIAGVFGSYLFNLGTAELSLRSFLRPLSATPLVIVPTIKLIESAGDHSALAYILLFGLSYQNGFFWERLLKSER
jgi:hypothetical protein